MGGMQQQLIMWQSMALELARKYEPGTAEQMAQGILGAAPPGTVSQPPQTAAEAPMGEPGTENAAHMIKAKENARNVSQPQ